MTLERNTPLELEVGTRTAHLHALLDVNGDPAHVLRALRQARKELDQLIRHVNSHKNINREKDHGTELEGQVRTRRRRKQG